MRIATLLLTATLALAACSQGAGGGLVDNWSRMPEPTAWQPKAETCHHNFEPNLMRSAYDPVDCAATHRFETVHVGALPHELREAPTVGTSEYKHAWAECDAKANSYLGGQWRDRQLRIDVSLPARDGWAAGSRWYMCQIGLMDWSGLPSTVLTHSLKGKWSALPGLEWGCGNQPDDTGEFDPVACDEPHDTEFVGSFRLDMSFSAVQAKYAVNDPMFHRECLKLIAAFVGARGADKLPRGTGSSYWLPDGKDWDAGDQSVRCFVWTGGRMMTRSVRNAGVNALT